MKNTSMSKDEISIKVKHTHTDNTPKKSGDGDIKILGTTVQKKKNMKVTKSIPKK
jgi:hypothetical protein